METNTMVLFSKTTIGKCFMDSLDEMVNNGTLEPKLAIQVVHQFDKSMAEAIKMHATHTFSIKGHLHWYKYCDQVWTFALRDALIKIPLPKENPTEKRSFRESKIDKVKIIAMDSALFN